MICKSLFLIITLMLCPIGWSQSNTDVFLLKVSQSNGAWVLSDSLNISDSPGYDNQPYFGLDSQTLLYVSDRLDQQTDVYEYSISKQTHQRLTHTPESEYSPRPSLDNKSISFVWEGGNPSESVWLMNRETKAYSWALQNKQSIGYYATNAQGDSIVWLRYGFAIHYLNVKKSVDRFIIGNVIPSMPHVIPGSPQFSFVHRQMNAQKWIKAFDPTDLSITPIIPVIPGQLDYCWSPQGDILMAKDALIYRYHPGNDDWAQLADLSKLGFKNMSRLAISSDGNYLAVVDAR